MSIKKCIERMEKFFLRALLASEKLDVIDQKKVGLTISLPKLDQIAVLDRVDELVDEKFAGEIHHLHVFFLRPDVLADGLHQMRLPETDAPVNKERVVSARRRLRDRETGGMRDFVVRANHKRFESVSWVEPEHACACFRVAL